MGVSESCTHREHGRALLLPDPLGSVAFLLGQQKTKSRAQAVPEVGHGRVRGESVKIAEIDPKQAAERS